MNKLLLKYRIWKREKMIRRQVDFARKSWLGVEEFMSLAGWSREKKKGLRKSIINGDYKFFDLRGDK
jgi:hypothetical protein